MKRFLILLLPIFVILTIGLTVFGLVQVRFEEDKMTDDLLRKAQAVTESIEASSRHLFLEKDGALARRLVESFQKRERIQGCALYDSTGRLLAITERIADWGKSDKPYLVDVMKTGTPYEDWTIINETRFFVYAVSVAGDDGHSIGCVETVYDTSYMYPILTGLWRRLSVALIVMVTTIVASLFIIQRKIFTIPIQRLTDWFARFYKEETDSIHPLKPTGELGKLASEVEHIALSLRVARKSISHEARVRLRREDRWDESKLRNLVHAKLGVNSFFVVSNREPYIHEFDPSTGTTRCITPASGVVTAIDPILKASGGTWIAHGSGTADKQFVNSKDKLGVPPDDNRYILKRVWLNKQEEDGYYYGFSNEGLWPWCHMTHTRPIFRADNWHMYRAVNRKFADTVLDELPVKNPFIFIQDYHFTLLGRMIKEKRPDASIALFWHIPWPNPEIVAICPYYVEILDGMLGCDLIGFHVQVHCNNFLESANRLLECRVDTERFSVVRNGKETFVRSFPISVDASMDKPADQSRAAVCRLVKEYNLDGKIIALGVDRIDYTKGIIERILAIDRFLEKYPEYKREFVFIQIAAPSRTHIKRYHDLSGEIEELVEKKNWKHSDGDWKPILYFPRHFTPEEVQTFYVLADICIVSALHDGMNLVAKEYVSAKQNRNGVLLLSAFTGAARELVEAVPINPYSIEEFADKIKLAAEMPASEKRSRMRNLRDTVREYNVYRWAGNIVTEWTGLHPSVPDGGSAKGV